MASIVAELLRLEALMNLKYENKTTNIKGFMMIFL